MYEFVRGKGIHLYDRYNKPFIDLISGIAVNNIGHCNPEVTKAIKDQVDKYSHQMVYGEYIVQPQVQLAKNLAKNLPSNLQSFYFLNSGSEAIEGAMKVAKKYTGRSKIVAMRNAYHGSSSGSLSMMSNEYYSGPFKPLLPNIYFMDYNDLDSIEIIDERTAAVFIEPIQAEIGYLPATQEFLNALREKCDKTGTLLIFDEIQTGIGRTGKLFAFEHYNITPDILVSAKALGGGMPIGAFISSSKIMKSIEDKPILGHISTFGGHPVCCAAGNASLNYIEKYQLLDKVSEKEALFRKLLVHPKIKKTSGKGLMLSIELDNFDEVERTMKRCMEHGVIIDWFLYNTNCLRISPPLIISNSEIHKVCKTILRSLD
ncbi:MAG: aminotransferase class III-fold pyridoxal phosphate-dependent enzyme [Bacteroidia bacterium]|nr:aminotransferase class III-fold pyridoxal phosphate-dependent enzyme [Bacteroidia bacterium]MDG2042142.1 aminotransferase class III-fold pyridoxal phosphate-dependent enzyme [Bacteroidia bacterium]|tara:strand:- start:31359 stop:32477 length:1119 start_codon:yes stop_codon:yes gene_type:complete